MQVRINIGWQEPRAGAGAKPSLAVVGDRRLPDRIPFKAGCKRGYGWRG
jgi:hypothetical protein